ncbi:MAG: exodeoxyribonuclease VII large subunit [Planctomycetes bacterium]|nr:exodeoxyribonuclease VII large subunit [Planctomycetota bacterium]
MCISRGLSSGSTRSPGAPLRSSASGSPRGDTRRGQVTVRRRSPRRRGLSQSDRVSGPVEGPSAEPATGVRIYTVAELSREIRSLLENSFPWVTVRGQVSNLSRPQSGHIYFSLVEDAGLGGTSRISAPQIPAVLWRSSAARLRFELESGMKVLVTGRLTVYEPRGSYQIVAERVAPEGIGDLQLAFEQTKERLRREGLFDTARKRPLPFLPRRIGLVTSPSGAAMRDFLRIVYQRYPEAWVRVVGVRVQGEGAAEEIAAAIDRLQEPAAGVDVIVVARGGGSIEDLWAFNEECVARALSRSSVPTVSAIGHEVDFTIADFVADSRAPTPTAAGEYIVADLDDLLERLASERLRLGLGLRRHLERRRALLDLTASGSQVLKNPQMIVEARFELLDRMGEALQNRLYNLLRQWDDSLFLLVSRLDGLSPLSVLSRGYSVTTAADGRVVRDARELNPADRITVRFHRGRARASVEETESDSGAGP